MVVRKRRKKNRLRGHRTMGAGDTKNRRGAGTRGGRGRGGSKKHKFTKYWKTFGVKVTLKPKPKKERLNLADLESRMPSWEQEKKVTKDNGIYQVDGHVLGIGKILGRGAISIKVAIRNTAVTKKAQSVIEAAGGAVEVPTPAEAENAGEQG